MVALVKMLELTFNNSGTTFVRYKCKRIRVAADFPGFKLHEKRENAHRHRLHSE